MGSSRSMRRGDRTSGSMRRGDRTSGSMRRGNRTSGSMRRGDRTSRSMRRGDRTSGSMRRGDRTSGSMRRGDRTSGSMRRGDRRGAQQRARYQAAGALLRGPYEVLQPHPPPHPILHLVHFPLIRLVVVPEGVEDAVSNQVADFRGQGVLLVARLAAGLIEGDDDLAGEGEDVGGPVLVAIAAVEGAHGR